MKRIPILISILLVVVSIAAVCWVSKSGLTPSERVTATISIAACLGALVSATFVVYSYLQTNAAYVESKRPQLLVQVLNFHEQLEGKIIDVTIIRYKNITNNRFKDLNINVSVTGQNREFDLSSLFTPRMVMVGQDQRDRTFMPQAELQSRGLNIDAVASQGNQVLLKILYEYTYQGITDVVNVQDYAWNATKREWHIV